jgi:hypothetical protein
VTIVLCSGCGKVTKRYTTKCDRCTRTTLEYFRSPDSERLNRRIKEITGRSPHAHPWLSSLLVVAVAVAITTAIGWKNHSSYLLNNFKPALQAAAPGTVPH